MKGPKVNYGKYLLLISLLIIIVLVTVSSGCFESEKALKVSLGNTDILDKQDTKGKSVRIGVFSMASPKMTMEYYQDFLDYLSKDTGLDFELVQRDNPAEINYLLKTKYLDAVFVRESDYFEGYEDFGMQVIAVPVIHGDIRYSSYVITRSDGNINSLEDLRNKRFAFNSYRFNRGEVVPDYMRPLINESPDSYFSSYIYSNSQDNFINMIAQGTLDGAEVDCVMWAYVVEDSEDYSSNLQIIHTSPPQLVHAVAVHPDTDKGFRDKIKTSLLRMHDSSSGRDVLKNMYFDMFLQMDHDTYASYEDDSRKVE
ncbi:MAG: PhnD/SsuA/transferrin family substrate-binding protein [Methanolobus sp.]|uniref:PhnD/SsuA/transferrin family substrate-binding protein n=1 Tax=Methanolobus sp. TaxID=1874737 RepID=UPI0027311943|nr:PhnD/SsuA/transferrin family substrate-binding protein [Methanolobus sp.]MDP2218100.1 PhnD/SsuA/transferrin family substrate-binding protein [Methanolobus sp.]